MRGACLSLIHPSRKVLPCAVTKARLLTPIVGAVYGADHPNPARNDVRSIKGESPLPQKLFASIVKHAPLIAVDLVIQNESGEVLLGLRRNAPARGFWFVPGGRIFKNEPIANAADRIVREELAIDSRLPRALFLGIFEHFYQDNFTHAQAFGTHYIVLAHRLSITTVQIKQLPLQQHAGYRWLPPQELLRARDVHPYSREYARHL